MCKKDLKISTMTLWLRVSFGSGPGDVQPREDYPGGGGGGPERERKVTVFVHPLSLSFNSFFPCVSLFVFQVSVANVAPKNY